MISRLILNLRVVASYSSNTSIQTEMIYANTGWEPTNPVIRGVVGNIGNDVDGDDGRKRNDLMSEKRIVE